MTTRLALITVPAIAVLALATGKPVAATSLHALAFVAVFIAMGATWQGARLAELTRARAA